MGETTANAVTTYKKVRRLQRALGTLDGELIYLAVHEYERATLVVVIVECWGRDEAMFMQQLLDALTIFQWERKWLKYVVDPHEDYPMRYGFTPYYQVAVVLEEADRSDD